MFLPENDRPNLLTARARKLRAKGNIRGALLGLGEACALDEENAARWMLYGSWLLAANRREDAERAMKQALWLRRQAGDDRRAAVIRTILERVEQGEVGHSVRSRGHHIATSARRGRSYRLAPSLSR
jgi:hypothetical protein